MIKVHAIFENGVFRPLEQVDLPERAEVEFEPRVIRNGHAPDNAMHAVFETLSVRFRSGHHGTAERHNEHQP